MGDQNKFTKKQSCKTKCLSLYFHSDFHIWRLNPVDGRFSFLDLPAVMTSLLSCTRSRITCSIPANFFSVKCARLFHLHRAWISEYLPTAFEDCLRFTTTSEDFLMTFEDKQRCRKIFDHFKTGPAMISKGFPTNLERY